jgi:uncharacterized protein (TIGR02118 family)
MAAYLIANIRVRDPETYQRYVAAAPAMVARFGGTYLVRGGASEILEGAPAVDRTVVIEFPSMQAIRDFHSAPEYQPLLRMREESTDTHMFCIEGYAGAASATASTRISILYPRVAGMRFDFDYYMAKHMPRSIELLGRHPGFRGVSVERGVGGVEPGAEPAYAAMCHFTFDSLASFLEAFIPHAPELQADIARYTDTVPLIQFSEVLLHR